MVLHSASRNEFVGFSACQSIFGGFGVYRPSCVDRLPKAVVDVVMDSPTGDGRTLWIDSLRLKGGLFLHNSFYLIADMWNAVVTVEIN